MKIVRTISALVMLAAATTAVAGTPKVIAHRGYWEIEGSAQNSISSLVKADSIGCYASEFDIWMTKDSVVVVNHDADINGIVIEKSTAAEVCSQKLANGENVPTLDQLLKVAQTLPIRLVCEVKAHDSQSMERACIKRTLDLMKKYGLEERVDYITFSRNGYVELVKKAPKPAEVYYLTGDYTPAQIKFSKGKGIDYSIKKMRKHPEWTKECHDLGLEVNVWTVNKPEDMQWCIEQGVDYITTNRPEELQKMLNIHKSQLAK